MRPWAWAVVTILLAGCESDPVLTPRNPAIGAFTSSEAIVARGRSVVLAWSVSDADLIEIRAMPSGAVLASTEQLAGSIVSGPIDEPTTFQLIASAGNKTVDATVSVMVEPGKGPAIISFSAVRSAIEIGESTELIWNVDGADQISVATSGGFVLVDAAPARGSAVISPREDASYLLEATNAFGTDSATVTVTVNQIGAPTINAFAANPTTITVGETSTITWDVSGAVSVVISNGTSTFRSEETSGILPVTPERSSLYTLTAVGEDGQSAQSQAMVTVLPGAPRIVACDLTPNPAPSGSEISIRWEALDAQEIRVLRESTEIFRTTTETNAGSFQTTIDQTANYRLEATSPFGSNSCSWYARAHQAPTIDGVNARVIAGSGGTYQVSFGWAVRNAARLDLLLGGVPVPSFPRFDALDTTDSQGTLDFTAGIGLLELVAESGGGVAVRGVLLGAPESEPNDSATEVNVLPEANITFVPAMIDAATEDWYQVEVPPGGSIYIDAANGGSCTGDTSLYLYRPPSTSSLVSDLSGTGIGACARIDPAVDSAARNMVGGTYLIRVDKGASSGEGGSQDGPYLLEVRIFPPNTCGDRLVSGNEECDGGPTCGVDCRILVQGEMTIGGPATRSFSGTLSPTDTTHLYRLNVTSDVSINASLFQPTAGSCGSGDLELTLRTNTLAQIVLGQPSGPACARIASGQATLAPGTYYVRVRNVLSQPLDTLGYELAIESIGLGTCGNGVLDQGEQCDDANMASGDGCSACGFEVAPARTITLPRVGSMDFSGAIDQPGGFEIYRIDVATSTTYLRAQTYSPTPGSCGVNTSLRVWGVNPTTGAYGVLRQETSAGCESIDPPALSLAPGTYYLQVSETTGAALPSYGLRIAGTEIGACGNGVVEGTETCDDGNVTSGDVCSATCVVEAESCGANFVVPRTGLRLSGPNFLAFANDHVISGTGCISRPGTQSELVFRIDLLAGDTLRVEETTSFDAIVSLQRGGCGTAACEYSIDFGENFQFYAAAPETVYFVVEAYSETTTTRAFDINIEIIPEVCGDGFASGNEECDDGNLADGDGCSSTCQVTAESCTPLTVIDADYHLAGSLWNRTTNDINLPSGRGCTVRTGREDLLFAVELAPGKRLLAREIGMADVTVSILRGATCADALAAGCTAATTTEDTGVMYANNTGVTETVFVVYEPDFTSDSAEPYEIDILVR